MPPRHKPTSIDSAAKNESETGSSVCAAQAPTKAVVAAATPAMKQYFEVKDAYADCLVFYRMGDFYELFFDDAVKAAQILDIALTKRGKHAGEEIPMCGVPVHAADMYLQRLIASGHKIAVCEQMETPEEAKKRGYKEVVRREVVRVVTPGTITEETLLAPQQSHYLAALEMEEDAAALAWLELSTGEFFTSEMKIENIAAQLARVAPRELLLSQATYAQLSDKPWFVEWKANLSIQPDSQFDGRAAERNVSEHYRIAGTRVAGEFTPVELSACGALLAYVKLTQLAASARLDIPRREAADTTMQMDAATRRNLELVQTQTGLRSGSLLSTIDYTVTAAGSRLLAAWLSAPLRDTHAITSRHDAVAWAVEATQLREQLRELLKAVPDMERAVGRLALGRGGPRDLALLATGLQKTNQLHEVVRNLEWPSFLSGARKALTGHHKLGDLLSEALMENVPHLARDGNFIRSDYRADLAEWRRLRDESKRVLAVMEADLKKQTDIASLKIKHNNVLGYFIEITQIHEKKVPAHFIHRQGLAGSLRYSTPELNETARKIEEAADKALKLELMIFDELVKEIIAQSESIIAAARALACIDVVTALAELAVKENWSRPTLSDASTLAIKAGRHPVVEKALKREHKEFIANDCAMNADARLWLITGPNMGGKSTFLRQQAILVILAQMGSFVPAQSAEIGLVDKLFCRVGAADDLARGQSTFMVEMVETASILHQATSQSLVVLDEIGRGTATYDGVSIAWAVAEHLHNVTKCRALFATHYHELTELSFKLPRLKNYHAAVKEYRDQIIFLHSIKPGRADKSYGIHVAALAGMPRPVLERARALLTTLESGHSLTEEMHEGELPLFQNAAAQPTGLPQTLLNERLGKIDLDNITPREALDILEELKILAKD